MAYADGMLYRPDVWVNWAFKEKWSTIVRFVGAYPPWPVFPMVKWLPPDVFLSYDEFVKAHVVSRQGGVALWLVDTVDTQLIRPGNTVDQCAGFEFEDVPAWDGSPILYHGQGCDPACIITNSQYLFEWYPQQLWLMTVRMPDLPNRLHTAPWEHCVAAQFIQADAPVAGVWEIMLDLYQPDSLTWGITGQTYIDPFGDGIFAPTALTKGDNKLC